MRTLTRKTTANCYVIEHEIVHMQRVRTVTNCIRVMNDHKRAEETKATTTYTHKTLTVENTIAITRRTKDYRLKHDNKVTFIMT